MQIDSLNQERPERAKDYFVVTPLDQHILTTPIEQFLTLQMQRIFRISGKVMDITISILVL